MATWLLLGLAVAGEWGVDRVEILSESDGSWMRDELPRWSSSERFVAVRFIEQVQGVMALPPQGLRVGLSLRNQTVRWEREVAPAIHVGVGSVHHAGLPVGALTSLAWGPRAIRVGTALTATSSASWARPAWNQWRVLPTVGIGVRLSCLSSSTMRRCQDR